MTARAANSAFVICHLLVTQVQQADTHTQALKKAGH